MRPAEPERCTCIKGVIGLCGACLEHLMGDGPKPLPPFHDDPPPAASEGDGGGA